VQRPILSLVLMVAILGLLTVAPSRVEAHGPVFYASRPPVVYYPPSAYYGPGYTAYYPPAYYPGVSWGYAYAYYTNYGAYYSAPGVYVRPGYSTWYGPGYGAFYYSGPRGRVWINRR